MTSGFVNSDLLSRAASIASGGELLSTPPSIPKEKNSSLSDFLAAVDEPSSSSSPGQATSSHKAVPLRQFDMAYLEDDDDELAFIRPAHSSTARHASPPPRSRLRGGLNDSGSRLDDSIDRSTYVGASVAEPAAAPSSYNYHAADAAYPEVSLSLSLCPPSASPHAKRRLWRVPFPLLARRCRRRRRPRCRRHRPRHWHCPRC